MHRHDLFHCFRFGELDVVKEATAQECVRQFFFVVGGDEDHRACFGFDELARFVAVKLHPIDLTQQVVRKLDVGLVDLVDQNRHRLVGNKGFPQHPFEDVVVDILDSLAAVDVR